MKDIDNDKGNALEIQVLKDLDAESDEEIITAEGDGYRIWRCNGVPIGIRIHKKRS